MRKEIVIQNEDLNITQPTRLGHTFLGWNVERVNRGEVDENYVQLTLTTKWKENKVAIDKVTITTAYYKEKVRDGKIENGYYVPSYEKIDRLKGDLNHSYKIGTTAWGDVNIQIKDYIYNGRHRDNLTNLVVTKQVMPNLKLHYDKLPNIITLGNLYEDEQEVLKKIPNKSISVCLTHKIHIDVQGGTTRLVSKRAHITFSNQLTTYVLEDIAIETPKKEGFVFKGWGINKIWDGYLEKEGIELQLTARWSKEDSVENKGYEQEEALKAASRFQYKKIIQPAILPKTYSKVRDVLNTVFEENNKVTRGEFVVVLTNILLNDEPYLLDEHQVFLDLKKDDFGYTAAHTLMNLGILNNDSDKLFRAEQYITRAQVAKMLIQANGGVYDIEKELVFKDLNKMHTAYESIQMALQSGYLKVKDTDYFNPDECVEGAEIIEILNRIYRDKSYKMMSE